MLQIPVEFTTKVDEFVAHQGLKMTYAKAPLGSEFFVRSNDLLFEQGINDIDINVLKWDDVPCFFTTNDKSSIPFDIFAASFYLISRYEEYLPHVQDEHERFSSEESIAFKNKFLEKPVVDIWVYKFYNHLKEKFPNYNYKEREFNFISTFDVDSAFAFKHKGVIRSLGGFLNDLIHLEFSLIWQRFLVLFNLKKDPFDTFDEILAIQKEYNLETVFFFLVSEYTTFDTNISANNTNFISLIKSVADFSKIGIHPSYFTMNSAEKLKKEKKKLENIINTPLKCSRQHYLRVELPETYQNLIDLDIEKDFSMGYSKVLGFRASTCTPFHFYDLDFEIQTPLKVYPFAFMDATLNDSLNLNPTEAFDKMKQLIDEVKNVNGTLVTLFHNETLSENNRWKGWKGIYLKMIQEII